MGQPVAVKVMEVQAADKYVANEVATNRLLDHPNIVKCYHAEYRPLVRFYLKQGQLNPRTQKPS
jgi:hypothetical protein